MHDAASHALPISLQAKLKSLRSPRANTSEPLRQGTTDICKTCRFISIRSRPPPLPVVDQIQYAVAIPLLPDTASPFRQPSGGPLQDGQPPRCAAVPHLRQESRPWHECHTSPRNREKPSTLPARARKRRPTGLPSTIRRLRFETIGFAICKNGRSQFIALRLVGGSRPGP